MSAEKNYDYVRTVEDLEFYIDKLISDNKTTGYDIETGYLGPDRKRGALIPGFSIVVGISFTNSLDWARYVPIAHDLADNIDPRSVARLFWKLFNSGIRTVAHNAKFELSMLSRWFLDYLADDPILGHQVKSKNGYYPYFSDSLIESYVKAETKYHGLKTITKENFDHQMIEIMELFPGLPKTKEKMIRFNVLELEPKVVKYACEDSVWCLANHLLNYPKVKNKLLFAVELECILSVLDMESTGCAFDWQLLADAAERGHEFLAALDTEIQEELSELAEEPISINLNSFQQVGNVLFNKLGFTTTRYTKTSLEKEKAGEVDKEGNPITRKMSTDKIALTALAKEQPVIKKLLVWKNMKKLLTSYLDKYEKEFKTSDDRIHAEFKQAQLPAGRFSSSNPNLQQLPKKYNLKTDSGKEFKFNFRDAVISPKGWYVLGFDFATQETRILAGEAQESYLFDAFAKGVDVHSATAALLYDKSISEIDKESKERSVGKTFNFALTYGLSIPSMAERLAISKEEAQYLYDKFFASYASVDSWMDSRRKFGQEHGYVVSRFGRRIPIWEYGHSSWKVRNKGDRIAVNASIQGAGADHVKIGMVKVRRALIEANLHDAVRLFLNVHDCLEFYVRDEIDPKTVIDLLTPCVSHSVPGWPEMRVDWHKGTRWGSVEEIKILSDGSLIIGDLAEDKFDISEEEIEDGEMALVDLTQLNGKESVTLEMLEPPTKETINQLVATMKEFPGGTSVSIKVNNKLAKLPLKTGLDKSALERILDETSSRLVR